MIASFHYLVDHTMNPEQRLLQNNEYVRTDSQSSGSSSGSETSSDSSSDESVMETEQSNLVSLPSSTNNSNSNSNSTVSHNHLTSYNRHGYSEDPDMAMLHEMGSNTTPNEDDLTIPAPAPRTNPPAQSSTQLRETDEFKRILEGICHRVVFNSQSTHAASLTANQKEVSEIGKSGIKDENPYQTF